MPRYDARLREALNAPLPLAEGRRNELKPRPLPLSGKASILWIATADDIEMGMAPGGKFEHVRAFANKGAEHAARIAGVLALIENLHANEISAQHLEAGVELFDFYLGEALRLQAAGNIAPALLQAETLRHWLKSWQEPFVSVPDIYRRGPNSIRDKSTAKKAVAILADHGWLIEAGPNIVKGERRLKTWRIWREAHG